MKNNVTGIKNAVTAYTTLFVLLASASTAYAADILIGEAAQLAAIGSTAGAELALPTDVEMGRDARLYVVDSGNHRVAVFDSTGTRVAVFGERGEGDGQLELPVGIGLGPKGEIYVADKGNHRLVLFSPDGRHRRNILLEEDGDEIYPVDVAVSADGRELFVSSNNTHRVVVYSDSGQYLRGWGGEGSDDGQFRYPGIIKIDAAGNVRVVDILNQRIQVFQADGTHVASVGSLGAREGTLFRPKGLALDASGRMYVGDSFTGVVQAFGPDLSFAFALGDEGKPATFETPTGMTIVGSRLYLVEMLAGRVLVLNVEEPVEPEAQQ